MRIAYVLARAPFGAQEQFVLAEGAEMLRQGEEVLFVPLRPGSQVTPGTPEEAAERAVGGRAWSVEALQRAAGEAGRTGGLVRSIRTMAAARDGEPWLSPGLRNAYALPRTLEIAARLREWRPDHIHAHFSASTATAAWIAADRLKVPWSFTAHSPTDISKRNLLAAKTEAAAFVRAISEHGRDLLAERLPRDLRGKPVVLPMGISKPPVEADVPRRFRRNSSERSIVCVGRLLEAKGQHLLLDAIARLARSNMPVTCHLVGDGPFRQDLVTLARRLNVDDRVVIHGYVANPEVVAALSAGAFDLLALPSASEGVPISLMEAMACGVRVVATDVGGVSELVDESAGELVRDGDAARLEVAIRRQLDDPAESAGPEIVRARYCLSQNVRQLRRLMKGRLPG